MQTSTETIEQFAAQAPGTRTLGKNVLGLVELAMASRIDLVALSGRKGVARAS